MKLPYTQPREYIKNKIRSCREWQILLPLDLKGAGPHHVFLYFMSLASDKPDRTRERQYTTCKFDYVVTLV